MKMYKEFGIDDKIIEYGKKIEAKLEERFKTIDEVAEYNQLKVIAAMQKNKVSVECFN
ncbi:MAG: methionine gamma-lyase family protein, partial [Lachnospiraceae bacterium]|nr:methionine gamma-lyase family protein [Lachnospiraceae bacterium]